MNNKIELNVSTINDEVELHRYLYRAFNFPDYYGNNWDAFDECIQEISRPNEIKVIGYKLLLAQTRNGAELFKNCLIDYGKNYPDSVNVKIS